MKKIVMILSMLVAGVVFADNNPDTQPVTPTVNQDSNQTIQSEQFSNPGPAGAKVENNSITPSTSDNNMNNGDNGDSNSNETTDEEDEDSEATQ